jgi:hypothetical protein
MWPFRRKANVLVWFDLSDKGVVDGVLDPFARQYHLENDSRSRATSVVIDLALAKRLGDKDESGRWNIGKNDTLEFDYYPTDEQLVGAYVEERIRVCMQIGRLCYPIEFGNQDGTNG